MTINKKGQGESTALAVAFIVFVMLLVSAMFWYPALKPWWASKTGQAELARADQNRQIAVLEAKAKKESAVLLAEAEVERAKGVAQANKIIGDSLKQNEDYLRYLYINGLVENDNIDKEIIYIPTEGAMPILEAGRNIQR